MSSEERRVSGGVCPLRSVILHAGVEASVVSGSHQQSKCVSYTSCWLQSSDSQTHVPRCPPPHAGMGKPAAIESVVCLLENPVEMTPRIPQDT